MKPKREKKEYFLKEYIFIFFLLILSFIIRLLIIGEIEKNGWLSTQLMAGTDMLAFDSQAQSILKGENVSFVGATSALYPCFLALVYSILGKDLITVFIIQTILALFSYFLLYLVAKRLFNKEIGLITLILALFYGPFILYEDSLLLDGPFTSSVSLILYFLVRLQENPTRRNSLILGIAIGISALLRGTILTFVPFLFLLFSIFFGRKAFILSFFLILGIIIPISPITIKNYIDTKEFIPLSTKGGTQFYIGNNPGSTGHSDSYPENYNEIAEKINKNPSPSKRSFLWIKESLRFIKNSPHSWIMLTLKKAWLFWDQWEIPNNVDYSHFKNLSKIMSLPIFLKFSLIAPLCLLGLILAIKRKETLGLVFFILSYFITITAFMVLGRYRIGVVPSLLPFGGYALFYLYNKKREVKIILPCFLLFLLFMGVNFSSTLKGLIYPLIYPNGVEIEKDGYLLIMDTPEEGGERETFTLNNPNRVIKKELIIKDISKIKDNCFFFFDFFGGPGIISIQINEKNLGSSLCPCSGGLLISGKANVPISMLKEGTNTISLKALQGSFEIPLERVLRYGRSFISDDGGKSWQRIERGEFTIRLKLKLK